MRAVTLVVLGLVGGLASAAPLRHDAMTQVMNRVDKAVRVVLKNGSNWPSPRRDSCGDGGRI